LLESGVDSVDTRLPPAVPPRFARVFFGFLPFVLVSVLLSLLSL
jgi:hypothetical protein